MYMNLKKKKRVNDFQRVIYNFLYKRKKKYLSRSLISPLDPSVN